MKLMNDVSLKDTMYGITLEGEIEQGDIISIERDKISFRLTDGSERLIVDITDIRLRDGGTAANQNGYKRFVMFTINKEKAIRRAISICHNKVSKYNSQAINLMKGLGK